ncbi:hypothetical protein ACFSQJ_18800 [Croceitalea marina]|uniref:Plantaricin C family lantibiotic n=1 Tax=Croceitalea marina TaxID=1775166 RepID=A0ABW5N1M0_9FLAO
MESKEFRKKIKEIPTAELYSEIEVLLANNGLENVRINGFSVQSEFNLTDKIECENDEGRYVCRVENGKLVCKCLGRKSGSN